MCFRTARCGSTPCATPAARSATRTGCCKRPPSVSIPRSGGRRAQRHHALQGRADLLHALHLVSAGRRTQERPVVPELRPFREQRLRAGGSLLPQSRAELRPHAHAGSLVGARRAARRAVPLSHRGIPRPDRRHLPAQRFAGTQQPQLLPLHRHHGLQEGAALRYRHRERQRQQLLRELRRGLRPDQRHLPGTPRRSPLLRRRLAHPRRAAELSNHRHDGAYDLPQRCRAARGALRRAALLARAADSSGRPVAGPRHRHRIGAGQRGGEFPSRGRAHRCALERGA